uniref:Uncharacterized protein n=1 Tax=Aegilops tauschii subsp. strangulata TaxID=200361 RepID=A0A453EJ06_AEGTS
MLNHPECFQVTALHMGDWMHGGVQRSWCYVTYGLQADVMFLPWFVYLLQKHSTRKRSMLMKMAEGNYMCNKNHQR